MNMDVVLEILTLTHVPATKDIPENVVKKASVEKCINTFRIHSNFTASKKI